MMIAIQTLSMNYKLTENPFFNQLYHQAKHIVKMNYTQMNVWKPLCLLTVMIFHLKLMKTWRLKSESYIRQTKKHF